jgi:hypothetical protein
MDSGTLFKNEEDLNKLYYNISSISNIFTELIYEFETNIFPNLNIIKQGNDSIYKISVLRDKLLKLSSDINKKLN